MIVLDVAVNVPEELVEKPTMYVVEAEGVGEAGDAVTFATEVVAKAEDASTAKPSPESTSVKTETSASRGLRRNSPCLTMFPNLVRIIKIPQF